MKFKTIALAIATVAVSAVSAAANSGFIHNKDTQDIQSQVWLDVVATNTPAEVQVFDYHKGRKGDLLGAKSIRAGSSHDLRVNLDKTTSHDVLVVLSANGQVLDTFEVDNERS